MTAFQLYDEFEREFEVLEEHPARHAAAVAMYALIGQKCAQRMTDGLVPRALLNKTFAAWPQAMTSLAIADLIAIGQWQESDGELRYVDWDVRQFTRVQESARREKHKERQRRYLARKIAAESGQRDASRDASDDPSDDGAPSPSPSPRIPNPSPKEDTENPSSRSGPPRSRSAVRVEDPVFVHWMMTMKKDPSRTKLTKDRIAKLAARRRDGYTDEQLCQAIDGCALSPWHRGENDRGEAYDDLVTILRDGKSVESHLQRLVKGGPKPVRPTGRMQPSRGTTAEDFADCEDIDTQIARIRGEAAQ